ncbi:MAG: GNAT family protein [Pseudomonadota bacterium]|nr:GNAT family protein [Pseudomonadota bacterium]
MNDVMKPRQWMLPVTLAGRFARLEPLTIEHVEPLQRAVKDGELWKLWFTSIPRPEAMPDYVEQALRAREAGSAMPFVVKDALGEVVGSTRFGHVDADNRRVEIGWTWYAARAQRTALNTECKQLLLTHAFEVLSASAVEFRTSWMNQRSRMAIARLGAKQDGVLRNHMRLAEGGYRDTVVFSIIESEWLAVKRHLQFLLQERKSQS